MQSIVLLQIEMKLVSIGFLVIDHYSVFRYQNTFLVYLCIVHGVYKISVIIGHYTDLEFRLLDISLTLYPYDR